MALEKSWLIKKYDTINWAQFPGRILASVAILTPIIIKPLKFVNFWK